MIFFDIVFFLSDKIKMFLTPIRRGIRITMNYLTDKFIATYFQPALPIDVHSIDMSLDHFS